MLSLITAISPVVDIGRLTENILSETDYAFATYLLFFLAGVLGALTNLLVRDNSLVLPRRVTGRLVLGCLGPMFVGGFVGIIADGSFSIACLSGYVGSSVLDHFIPIISSQLVKPASIGKESETNI